MKKILFTTISLSIILLCSCGHNLMTNYKVKGLDLSIPIGGYPIGVRIGIVDVNSNVIRGNSSYTMHEDSSKVGGSLQSARVIQFASNTQLNEGNISDIIRDDEVDISTKQKLIENIGLTNSAPQLSDSSVKTPSTSSAVSDKYKIHKAQDFDNVDNAQDSDSVPDTHSLFGNVFSSIIMKTLKEAFGAFFMGTYVGRVIIYTLRALIYILVILVLSSMIKKIFRLLKFKIKKNLNTDKK